MAHESRASRLLHLAAILALVTLSGACRKGDNSSGSGGVSIPPPFYGASGCNGANQGFGSLSAVSFAQLDIGPASQLAAATGTLATSGTYEVYVTGEAGTLVELVFDAADPDNPTAETVLLAPGDVDGLPEYAAVAAPAELSGVAVLDPAFLVVVENTGNTLLLVSRDVPGDVSVFPALVPSEAPGNADGSAGQIRFSFGAGTQIVPTGDGRIFVADPGNHSLRALRFLGLTSSVTVAGTGAPFHSDASLPNTGFDTPMGLVLGCDGSLVVAETGASGVGGHRLRTVSVGEFDFFSGGFEGQSRTLVGDGTALTTGGSGGQATAAGPVSPVTSAQDEIYWVDSLTGVLRRYDRDTDMADCPLFADCASATAALGMAPNFTSMGGGFSLATAENGVLYALDADAEELWRLVP